MDESRFDGLTRTLANGLSRRQTLRGVAGGTLAGLLAHLGLEETSAACVKLGKKGCKGPKNKECCSGARCKGGNKNKEGRCVCKGSLKQCGTTCVNLKTDKNNCGKCNRECASGHTCMSGVCTSEFGCTAGQNYCTDSLPAALCPGRSDCACITDVNGAAYCADVSVTCSDCVSNAECPDGRVCIDASSANFCACPGNGCAVATCQGISGSGAGRTRLTTPVFR